MRDVSGGTKIAAFEGMVAPGRVPAGMSAYRERFLQASVRRKARESGSALPPSVSTADFAESMRAWYWVFSVTATVAMVAAEVSDLMAAIPFWVASTVLVR